MEAEAAAQREQPSAPAVLDTVALHHLRVRAILLVQAIQGVVHHESMGVGIEQPDAWSIKVGGMHGVAIELATGVMTGGADSRRDGTAIAPAIPLRMVETTSLLLDPDAAQQQ